MVKVNIFIFLFTLFILNITGLAQTKSTVKLFGNQVEFSLPKDVEEIKTETFNFKFANKDISNAIGCCLNERLNVFTNKNKTFLVGASFFDTKEIGSSANGVTEDVLPSMKQLIEERLTKNLNDIHWQEKAIILMNNKKVIHLRFKTKEDNKTRLYEMYFTDHVGYLLSLSFTVIDAPKETKLLQETVATIKLDLIQAVAPRRTTP